jgi:lipid-A-disaccharide synthase
MTRLPAVEQGLGPTERRLPRRLPAEPPLFMVVAGEPSGDALAAELVRSLQANPAVQALPFPPRFIGAGGPLMSEAGVKLALELTQHAVVGIAEVVRHYFEFRALFQQVLDLAFGKQPDVIILVDFSGFNRRLASAIRKRLRAEQGLFVNWSPRIVQYVSPQVWASRPGRADSLARDVDLLLCLLPFEKQWYEQRAPALRVEFVGHPLVDRHATAISETQRVRAANAQLPPLVVLLPGSRLAELERHLPVMLAAARLIAARHPVRFRLVVPNAQLAELARTLGATALPGLETTVGGLAESLAQAALALACTGTVTLECALFGVPTVALYKTSWLTYYVARQVVTVKYLAMPNLLAKDTIFPEFIQGEATPENLANAANALLADANRRQNVQDRLEEVVKLLGEPGASDRAAQAVLDLL